MISMIFVRFILCFALYTDTHLATVETWEQNRYIRDTCFPPGAYNTTGCGPSGFISNCAWYLLYILFAY